MNTAGKRNVSVESRGIMSVVSSDVISNAAAELNKILVNIGVVDEDLSRAKRLYVVDDTNRVIGSGFVSTVLEKMVQQARQPVLLSHPVLATQPALASPPALTSPPALPSLPALVSPPALASPAFISQPALMSDETVKLRERVLQLERSLLNIQQENSVRPGVQRNRVRGVQRAIRRHQIRLIDWAMNMWTMFVRIQMEQHRSRSLLSAQLGYLAPSNHHAKFTSEDLEIRMSDQEQPHPVIQMVPMHAKAFRRAHIVKAQASNRENGANRSVSHARPSDQVGTGSSKREKELHSELQQARSVLKKTQADKNSLRDSLIQMSLAFEYLKAGIGHQHNGTQSGDTQSSQTNASQTSTIPSTNTSVSARVLPHQVKAEESRRFNINNHSQHQQEHSSQRPVSAVFIPSSPPLVLNRQSSGLWYAVEDNQPEWGWADAGSGQNTKSRSEHSNFARRQDNWRILPEGGWGLNEEGSVETERETDVVRGKVPDTIDNRETAKDMFSRKITDSNRNLTRNTGVEKDKEASACLRQWRGAQGQKELEKEKWREPSHSPSQQSSHLNHSGSGQVSPSSPTVVHSSASPRGWSRTPPTAEAFRCIPENAADVAPIMSAASLRRETSNSSRGETSPLAQQPIEAVSVNFENSLPVHSPMAYDVTPSHTSQTMAPGTKFHLSSIGSPIRSDLHEWSAANSGGAPFESASTTHTSGSIDYNTPPTGTGGRGEEYEGQALSSGSRRRGSVTNLAKAKLVSRIARAFESPPG